MRIYQIANDFVQQIKDYLTHSWGYESYEDFVDNQSMGDCQVIVYEICLHFPFANKVFGEIEIDGSYYDEDGEEHSLVTHHWIKIGGIPYDFSKGTLKNHIEFDSIYDPEISLSELDKYH
jgi:hypothetical protein